MNVPQPPQCEINELTFRVLCIIDLCKDIIFKAKLSLNEQAEREGQDVSEEEVALANVLLKAVPMLRLAFSTTATSGASGDPSNPLKRNHDSMVNNTAVSLVLQIF